MCSGHPVRQHEVTLGLREVHQLAGLRLLDEEPGHALPGRPVVVGAQRDREPVAGARVGAGDGEDPRRTPGAAELDPELDVLAGAVALPGAGGLQRDRRDGRVAGDVDLAAHLDDPRADLVGRPHRVDLLEVAVDAVRRGQGGERPGAEHGLGDAHACLLT